MDDQIKDAEYVSDTERILQAEKWQRWGSFTNSAGRKCIHRMDIRWNGDSHNPGKWLKDDRMLQRSKTTDFGEKTVDFFDWIKILEDLKVFIC